MSESDFELTPPPKRGMRRKVEKVPPPELIDQREPTTAGALAAMTAAIRPNDGKGTLWGVEPVSYMFFICLLAGGAMAFFGTVSNPLFRWIGVVGPIGATVFYPAWGWKAGLHKSPSVRERFADNCYYVGFIFTQIALVAGFLPVALFNTTITSQDILRFFGVALGSSLVGLVARTLFVQTGHSVSENADIVQQEVEIVARHVSQQAGRVLGEFDGLTKRLSETYQRLSTELETCVSRIVVTMESYDTSVKRDISGIGAAARAMSDSVSDTASGVERGQAALTEALDSAGGAVRDLHAGLQAEVANASQAIRQMAQTLTAGLGALESLGGIGDSVGAIDARLVQVRTQLEGIEGAIGQASEGIVTASQQTAEFSARAVETTRAAATERADAFKGELQGAIKALEDVLTGFRTELERLRV